MIRRTLKWYKEHYDYFWSESLGKYTRLWKIQKEESWAYLPSEIDEFNSAMIINKCYENCWEEDGKFDRKGIPL